MIQINVIALAFSEMGIPSRYVFAALVASLLGSFINIPVKKIHQDTMVAERTISSFGIRYFPPVGQRRETLLAINLGGQWCREFFPELEKKSAIPAHRWPPSAEPVRLTAYS